MNLPTDYLSFSQVDTYLNCPKKYEWRYIIKPEIVSHNPIMVIGSQLHELIANILNKKKKNPYSSIKHLKQMTDSQFKLQIELKKIQCEIGKSELLESEIEKMLTQHNSLFEKWFVDILPELKPTSIEQKIETSIGGFPFIMYIDAIHDNRRVIDWKVTGSPKNKYQVNNSLQLSIYSIGTELSEVAFCSLIRPKPGKEKFWKPNVQMIKGYRTNNDRKWATEVVKSVGKGICNNYFPLCSPENFLCDKRYCDYYNICRGKKNKPPKWMNMFF